jgi:hypothetical protein
LVRWYVGGWNVVVWVEMVWSDEAALDHMAPPYVQQQSLGTASSCNPLYRSYTIHIRRSRGASTELGRLHVRHHRGAVLAVLSACAVRAHLVLLVPPLQFPQPPTAVRLPHWDGLALLPSCIWSIVEWMHRASRCVVLSSSPLGVPCSFVLDLFNQFLSSVVERRTSQFTVSVCSHDSSNTRRWMAGVPAPCRPKGAQNSIDGFQQGPK